MEKFKELTKISIEWTKIVLFRPFNLKKWLILGLIAYLAGTMFNGSSSNISNPFKAKKSEAQSTGDMQKNTPVIETTQTLEQVFDKFQSEVVNYLPLAISGVILLLICITFLIWLNARFTFVLLEDTVNNDASIKNPFFRNKTIGNSLFSFSIIFESIFTLLTGVIAVFCFLYLQKNGVFTHSNDIELKTVIIMCIPYFLYFFSLLLAVVMLKFFIENFVVPIMYKDQCGFIAACQKTVLIYNTNEPNIKTFFFLKIAFFLIYGLGYFIISMVVIFILMLPITLLISISYALQHVLSGNIYTLLSLGIKIICTLLSFAGGCVLMYMYLPGIVFLRTFNLYVLAYIAPEYDLFLKKN